MPRVPPEHLAAQRRRVVEAAALLVATKGVPETTMRDVIAASGMSAGAVYHYFPTKAGLLEAIGALVQDRYSAAVQALLDRPEPPGPVPSASPGRSSTGAHSEGVRRTVSSRSGSAGEPVPASPR